MMDKKIDRISQTFEAKLILLEGQLKFMQVTGALLVFLVMLGGQLRAAADMQGSSYAAPETSLASHGSAYLMTSHGSAYHAPQQIPNGMHHKVSVHKCLHTCLSPCPHTHPHTCVCRHSQRSKLMACWAAQSKLVSNRSRWYGQRKSIPRTATALVVLTETGLMAGCCNKRAVQYASECCAR